MQGRTASQYKKKHLVGLSVSCVCSAGKAEVCVCVRVRVCMGVGEDVGNFEVERRIKVLVCERKTTI